MLIYREESYIKFKYKNIKIYLEELSYFRDQLYVENIIISFFRILLYTSYKISSNIVISFEISLWLFLKKIYHIIKLLCEINFTLLESIDVR